MSTSSAANSKDVDLFALSLEQKRRITEMEKQVDFYKEKCLDLKLALNMQQVTSNDMASSQKHESEKAALQ